MSVASLQKSFQEAQKELMQAFVDVKKGKTPAQVSLIERIQAKALQTLDAAMSSIDMSFALIEEASSDKLEWQYQYGHRLGQEGKNPASLTAPHLEGFFDGQKNKPAIC